MKLSQKQRIFTRNIGLLIEYAYSIDIELTFGEAFRTQSQVYLYFFGYEIVKGGILGIKLQKSKKLSKTLYSKHQDRLAVDFNFFINGRLTYDYHKIKPLGDFWVCLYETNRWGGDFNKNGIKDGFIDTPHFEMQ
jgi:hypothetical protein